MAFPSKPSPGATGGSYTVPSQIPNGALSVTTARDFVVLGGLVGDRYAIRWSAIGDPTDWPVPNTDDASSKQSGQQNFPTKFGWVTSVVGQDFYMLIFQEKAITRATYTGGSTVWSFDTFEEGRGCVRQGRTVAVDDAVFFNSDRGLHVIENDAITDIGYGIVDDSYS